MHFKFKTLFFRYPTQSQLSLWDEYAKNFIKSFLNIPVTHSFFENFPEIDSSSETGIIGK